MTAAEVDETPFPFPATDQTASPRRRPRNFLARAEHRTLFWWVMPPAIVAVVAVELFTRAPAESPSAPPRDEVDTRLAELTGPLPDDAVVIVRPDEPPQADEAVLAASPRSLAKVRDATFFRKADEDAWLESCLTLRGYDGRRLPPPRDVGFTEIFGQPASFRGRAVRMRGTLRRLERLPAPRNDYGIEEYWQGWLEPADGPASPVAVHFLEVPAGMPTGLSIRESVVVDGCFLKNMAYRAVDTVRVAPLLLARAPVQPPATPVASGVDWSHSLGAVGVVTMLGFVTMVAIGFLLAGRVRTPSPSAPGLDAVLAGVEPVSVGESLRRMAVEERARVHEPAEEPDA
ncbi:MAG: hypothetical protein FJ284_06970 [Planctomycetes bacterium]|nr:hypothetical protein [Planctomycetota bacterium]